MIDRQCRGEFLTSDHDTLECACAVGSSARQALSPSRHPKTPKDKKPNQKKSWEIKTEQILAQGTVPLLSALELVASSRASSGAHHRPLHHCHHPSPSPSVAPFPSADTLRPAPATAALLNASGSEDSHRERPIPAGVVASSDMHGAAGRSEEVQTDDRSGLPDGQEPPAQEQYCRACANEQDNDTERATHRCTECGPMCKVDFKNNLQWHVV
jgi:hypothetical protein